MTTSVDPSTIPAFLTTGRYYPGDPLPIVESRTRYLVAGAITFGIEGRALVARGPGDAVDADLPAEPWAGGATVHVLATADGLEHLRFDCFDDQPHYHYLVPGVSNYAIDYDAVANGPMIPWTIDRLRRRLPDLLRLAGADDLAAAVDPDAIAAVLDEVEALLWAEDRAWADSRS